MSGRKHYTRAENGDGIDAGWKEIGDTLGLTKQSAFMTGRYAIRKLWRNAPDVVAFRERMGYTAWIRGPVKKKSEAPNED